ncbi:hypothetical protein [Cognatiyoonia sp. IB215182]|uniref:hypothetical protein n=1 Tax=Cognatiyoonia sp. IB215182 TaxID=3097353 RepID=UPI002A14DBFC|nr:hypothetical protein [Cognatiyoonia sp. IB215182]MDX8354824.1 hypothetical protein [Cognatiyoonia sp. IB215182]
MSFIPKTYEEWKHCIIVKCDILLTQTYVAERLEALNDHRHFQTQQFIDRWGEAHHAQTVVWFQQAAKELAT